MAGRHFRHEAPEQGAKHPGQPFDDAGFLGNAQEAQPEGEGAEQQDHHLDRQLGHGEDTLDHGGEDAGIAAHQPLQQRRHGCHYEKAKP
ncbi:hypothetical protein D3C84_111070 [compost metagenome]